MKSYRSILLAIVLVLPVATAAAAAETTPAPAHMHSRHGALHRVLQRLDLSADQRTRIAGIHSSLRPRLQSVHEAMRRDRDALAATPPTDPGFAPLLEQSKLDAAQAIQLRGDAWSQVYAVLTPEQRAQVPGIVAEVRAEREARRGERHRTGAMGPT